MALCRKTMIVFFCCFRHCATWASMGECQKNPSWMLMNCKISCGECDNKCTDHNSFCPEWANLGECKKNPQYMNLYCKKSCKKCQVSHIYFHISMARQKNMAKSFLVTTFKKISFRHTRNDLTDLVLCKYRLMATVFLSMLQIVFPLLFREESLRGSE